MKKRILNSMLFLVLSSSSLIASANAGYEKEIDSGEKVVLDGTESTVDYGGRFIRSYWVQVDRNKRTKIYNKRSLSSAIIAPDVKEATTFRFALVTTELYSINRNKTRENYRISKTHDFVNIIVYPRVKKPLEGISGLKPPQHSGLKPEQQVVNNSSVKAILPPKTYQHNGLGTNHEIFLTEPTKVETRFKYNIKGVNSNGSQLSPPVEVGVDILREPTFIKNINPKASAYGYDAKTSEIIVPAGVSSFILQITTLDNSHFSVDYKIYEISVGNKSALGRVDIPSQYL